MESVHLEKRQTFVDEALRILDAAKSEGVILRVIGAVALDLHVKHKESKLVDLMCKRMISDLDFVCYGKQYKQVISLLEKFGYVFDRRYAMHAADRIILTSEDESKPKVDIFLDKLEFCHTIEFTKNHRLEVDCPTISVSDILLEKTQIVELNEKDVIDIILLFAEHDIGNDDDDKINLDYVNSYLAEDWGFYYTVTSNLKKIRDQSLSKYALDSDESALIRSRIEALLHGIEEAPKSLKWKMRAKVGPSKRWYKDVEECAR